MIIKMDHTKIQTIGEGLLWPRLPAGVSRGQTALRKLPIPTEEQARSRVRKDPQRGARPFFTTRTHGPGSAGSFALTPVTQHLQSCSA